MNAATPYALPFAPPWGSARPPRRNPEEQAAPTKEPTAPAPQIDGWAFGTALVNQIGTTVQAYAPKPKPETQQPVTVYTPPAYDPNLVDQARNWTPAPTAKASGPLGLPWIAWIGLGVAGLAAVVLLARR